MSDITQSKTTNTPPVKTFSASTSNDDAWKYRRRFMFAITGFDMAVVLVALLVAKMESVGQIAIIMGFGSLTAIFGFYVAGAVWDDHSIRQFQIKGLALAGQNGGDGDGDDHDGHDGKGGDTGGHQGP